MVAENYKSWTHLFVVYRFILKSSLNKIQFMNKNHGSWINVLALGSLDKEGYILSNKQMKKDY